MLVPREVISDGWPEYLQTACDFHYKYRFVPGGLTFTCTNNQVLVKLSGTYQVAGEKCICAFGKQTSPWIGGSCGFGKEPMRKTDIFITSALQLRPNYTVHTITTTQRVTAQEKCIVSIFNLDITQQVMDSIKSSTNAFCFAMDSVVNGLDFSTTTKALAERTRGDEDRGPRRHDRVAREMDDDRRRQVGFGGRRRRSRLRRGGHDGSDRRA